MGCLGLHLALTEAEIGRLRALEDEDRVELIREEFEERLDEPDALSYQSDKAWDAMHRCLSDGTLNHGAGTYPLNHAVLGGDNLYSGDDYIIRAVSPKNCAEVAAAFTKITEDWMRKRYWAIIEDDYGFKLSEEDFAYTWDWFNGLDAFFRDAADRGLWVIFTADQ